MFMFKKATVVGLAVILAAVVVASAAYRVSTREQSPTSTTEVPSAATTKAEATTKPPTTETSSATTTKAEATTKLPTTHSSTTRWTTRFTTQRATNVTTVRVWDAPFQTKELKTFYEKHKKTMQELADILISQDVKSLNISLNLYNGDPIDEKLIDRFYSFIATMEAEANAEPQIAVGGIDGKRLITFAFTAYPTGETQIQYMPDGYVRVRDREPELNEIIYSHESKLGNKWYSYWW
jgi:hypothetical protein